jgi:hopene-associated glycosyltransferase HpnB
MPAAAVLTLAAAAAWAYLLAARGQFWRTRQRLPIVTADPPCWPAVAAVVPARNEAAVLPGTLPALLGQHYPGAFRVILVDDDSTDGTAAAAAGIAAAMAAPAGLTARPQAGSSAAAGSPGPRLQVSAGPSAVPLHVVAGTPTPAGWAGKVWAMEQGVRAAGDTEYLLFTDADIGYAPGTLAALVRSAESGGRDLLSQMALLRAATFWERLIVPAFVYFFAQLYPFALVNRRGTRTAAAAGGCMLVRRGALEAAGGLEAIRGARIDDVALGRLLKRGRGAACWLGLSTEVTSERAYPGLAPLWDMVARSAYTQLRYSPVLLAGTVAGLAWLYLLPPAAALAGLIALAAGGGAAAGWLLAGGLAGWLLMTVSYLPMLALYRLSPLRAPGLPLVAGLYAAMTIDSARRHHAGRGGEWKGRIVPPTR